MIKKTIQYEDFDGNMQEETAWFHLSKSRLLENIDLKDELEEIKTQILDEDHDLTTGEILKVLNMVKRIMQLAYGVRSEDGKKFNQDPKLWEEFSQTAAYDSLLYSMFQNEEDAFKFITEILPKSVREEAMNSTEMKELQAKHPAIQAAPVAEEEESKDARKAALEAQLAALEE